MTTVPLVRHRIRGLAWSVPATLAVVVAAGCQTSSPAANKPPATDGPAVSATTSAAGKATSGRGGGCPSTRASGRRSGPASAPAGVSWQMFHGVAVPASATLGPKRTAGDIARCYAHDSSGALLAAAQIGVRYPLSTRWKTVVEEQTFGDGRDGYVRARTTREAEAGGPPTPAAGEMLQLAGFRFDSYSDRRAVISLAYRQPGGALIQAATVTMEWQGGAGGDWRYEIPRSPGPYQKLNSLKGYVAWGAGR
ncbi:hypothetical protein [Streptomyces sp. NPDC002324]